MLNFSSTSLSDVRQIVLAAIVGLILCTQPSAAGVLDDVKSRGKLVCGVAPDLVGFSSQDASGEWHGFDVDFCRAVSSAIFQSPDKIEFVALTYFESLSALSESKIDILARGMAKSLSLDEAFDFVGMTYFDGHAFLVPKDLGVSSARELDGASVCSNRGDDSKIRALDYFEANRISPDELITAPSFAKGRETYLNQDCDVYVGLASNLAGMRATFNNSHEHVILPEIISQKLLGPIVRQDDSHWAFLLGWVRNLLVISEQLGVNSQNVEEMASNSALNNILSLDADSARRLQLKQDWAFNVIRTVGNYGEIFKRNIGENTNINISRGLNEQWINGGLLYAPEFK